MNAPRQTPPPSVYGLHAHPQRGALDRETHARPPEELCAPVRATHLAMLSGTGAAAIDNDRRAVARLCEHYGVRQPDADAVHISVECGGFRLKWERHTEFSAYSFYLHETFLHPFERPAISLLPPEWLQSLPGSVLVAAHMAIEPARSTPRDTVDLHVLFGTSNLAGGRVLGGSATVWSDFHIHGDGFSRILIHDHGLQERQAGRLAQRLLDIETYRTLALLGFPLAREAGGRLDALDARLVQLTASLAAGGIDFAGEQRLLDELAQLAAESESTLAATSYRFAASRAYRALVEKRIAELREERIEGMQSIEEFMDRRFSPAMRTLESVRERQEHLSRRVSRAATLLRTRVEVKLERQNSALLDSMNRRAQLQLRLQETVEGLSVVVLTYYLVSLIGYALKGIQKLGVPFNLEITTAIAIAPAALLVHLGLRRLRRRLGVEEDQH